MNRLLFALAILLPVGCGRETTTGPPHVATVNGLVEFEFPADWFEYGEENPFDLQWDAGDHTATTAVFLFVEEEFTPRELFALQIDDLRSKRENLVVLEEEHVVHREGKTLTTVVFSGIKDGSTNYYKLTLIELAENADVVPIVVQIVLPRTWNRNKPILESITESARIRP